MYYSSQALEILPLLARYCTVTPYIWMLFLGQLFSCGNLVLNEKNAYDISINLIRVNFLFDHLH